jgi:hypothetical protein
MPMTAMACPAPPPGQSVPMSCGGPVTVTGARLGLSVQQDSDGVLLVPSWLFDVTGSAQPLVQLAVQPRLLRAAPGAPGGSGGGLPGVSGTAQPVPPGPPSRFSSVTRGSDDRSLQVTFWGGVPECYSYAVRAVEDHQAVRLRVTETRDPGNRVCIDLAVEVKRTVHLEAPLGLRLVLDAVTGEVLLGPTR